MREHLVREFKRNIKINFNKVVQKQNIQNSRRKCNEYGELKNVYIL